MGDGPRGKYDEARRIHEQGLRRETELLGEEHPDTLNTAAALGSTAHLKAAITTTEKSLLMPTLIKTVGKQKLRERSICAPRQACCES